MNNVLIDNLVQVVGTRKLAKEVVSSMLLKIEEILANGGEVKLPGVGKLCVVKRNARKGRNIKTGEVINVPETNVVKFKPSGRLKNKVKGQ